MKHTLYIILSFCFLVSCVTPIDLEPREAPKTLVVEGFISTKPGVHTVRLSRTGNFVGAFEVGGIIPSENRAQVFIRELGGQVTHLIEQGNGRYNTPPGFAAEVGNSYSLFIQTADGERYVSSPELVSEPVMIEDVFLRFEKKASAEVAFESGVNVFLSFQDPGESRNFYLMEATDGVYPFTSHPDMFPCDLEEAGEGLLECSCVPTGLLTNCFRYERDYLEFKGEFRTDSLCTFVERSEQSFELASDLNSNGNLMTPFAAYVEDDGRRFEFSYRTDINLYSISEEAFNYYNTLAGQLSIRGRHSK